MSAPRRTRNQVVMSRVPTFEQWSTAIEQREARLLCFEAIGYARGFCDATGIGSGDAIDFGHAFAVLVAARGSRPSIEHAWANWRAGRPIGLFPTGRREGSVSDTARG
ncbi:hypothetical protein [Nocardia xishanensis]|uniref:Uncharacterized protein n=1 Tax=Nocardia xishanensis TaxID=238964 RepID=A0ABW7XCB3_9NOCA